MRVFFLLLFMVPLYAAPMTYQMNKETSVFALITHKKGVFASMAHNHFIVAQPHSASMTKAEDGSWQMDFTFKVDDLKVDPYDLASTHYPRLETFGLLDEAFEALKDKDREKIRESMLARGQLNAKKYPTITAKLESVNAKASKVGGVDFPQELTVSMTIKGETKPVTFAANVVEGEDGKVRLEALAKAKFTDFGIKPYSAFLGAVANADNVEFYLVLEMTPEAP
jgi:hypothetical protein